MLVPQEFERLWGREVVRPGTVAVTAQVALADVHARALLLAAALVVVVTADL